MEPEVKLTLSLSVVNAALNALEQQGHNVGNAIAAIKNQAVAQLQPQAVAGPQASPLPELADIQPAPV